jgi:hypothetical protein
MDNKKAAAEAALLQWRLATDDLKEGLSRLSQESLAQLKDELEELMTIATMAARRGFWRVEEQARLEVLSRATLAARRALGENC